MCTFVYHFVGNNYIYIILAMPVSMHILAFSIFPLDGPTYKGFVGEGWEGETEMVHSRLRFGWPLAIVEIFLVSN